MSGSRPQESKCTLIRLPVILDPNYKTDDWHATLVENQEKVTKLSIVPAADASIGYYQVGYFDLKVSCYYRDIYNV